MLCESDTRPIQRAGSFSGVPFHVEKTDDSYGHRTVVHEFPLVDAPHIEALGTRAAKISISGYFVGPMWLVHRDAIIAAVEGGKGGTLVHPFYGAPIRAVATDITVSHAKDDLGRIRFELTLVRSTSRNAGGLSAGYLLASLGAAVDEVIGASFQAAIGSLNTVAGRAASEGIEAAIRESAILLDEARLLSIVSPEIAPRLGSAVQDLFSRAESISRNPSALPLAAANIATLFRQGIEEPLDGLRVLSSASEYQQDFTPRAVGAASRIAMDHNYATTTGAFRRAFGAVRGEFLARSHHQTRSSFEGARNEFLSWHQAEASLIEPSGEVSLLESFDRMRAAVTGAIASPSPSSGSPISISMATPLPAIVVATKVHGDPGRFDDVWKQSGSAHPSFVGPFVEVGVR